MKDNARNVPILLVGNKLDLAQQREVSKEQIEKIREVQDISSTIEISAKAGENVEKMISTIANMMLNHWR